MAGQNGGERRRLKRQSFQIGRRFDPSQWSGGVRLEGQSNSAPPPPMDANRAKALGSAGIWARSTYDEGRKTALPPSPTPYLFQSILPQCCQCGIGEAGPPGPPGPVSFQILSFHFEFYFHHFPFF